MGNAASNNLSKENETQAVVEPHKLRVVLVMRLEHSDNQNENEKAKQKEEFNCSSEIIECSSFFQPVTATVTRPNMSIGRYATHHRRDSPKPFRNEEEELEDAGEALNDVGYEFDRPRALYRDLVALPELEPVGTQEGQTEDRTNEVEDEDVKKKTKNVPLIDRESGMFDSKNATSHKDEERELLTIINEF